MKSPFINDMLNIKDVGSTINPNINLNDNKTGVVKAPVSPFLDNHINIRNPNPTYYDHKYNYEQHSLTPTQYYYIHNTDFTGYNEQLKGDLNVRWDHNDNDIQAAMQPLSEKWGNAGVQFIGTLAGEIVTLAGAILKLPEAVGGGIEYAATGESDYFNDMFNGAGGQLMEWGIDFQNYIRDEFEIKTSSADQDSFNITSGAWWASNAPSIASVVSSMIVPLGVVKGASLLGKGATKMASQLALTSAKNAISNNAIKYLGKAASATGKVINSGMFEKTLYTAMATHSDIFVEVAHGFKDKVDEFKALGYTDEESNSLAGQHAADSYVQGTMYGLAFNALESRLMLGKGSRFGKTDTDIKSILDARQTAKINGTASDINARSILSGKDDILNAISKRTTKDAIRENTLNMINEGFEEMRVDFIMNEADRNVRINNDLPVFDLGSNIFNRIIDHLSEGKNWTSGLFGAIGAGISKVATAKRTHKQEVNIQNEYLQNVLNGVEKIDGIVSEYANAPKGVFDIKQSNGTDDIYIKKDNDNNVIATPVQDIVQTLMTDVNKDGGVHIDAYLGGILQMSDSEIVQYMNADKDTYDAISAREFIKNVKSEIDIAKNIRRNTERKYRSDNSNTKENKILFESALTYATDYNNRVIARIDNELNASATDNISIKDIKSKLKEYPTKYKKYIKAKTNHALKVKELRAVLNSIETDSKKAYSFVSPNNDDVVQLESEIKVLESKLETAIITASTGDKRDINLINNATKIAKEIESKRIAIRGINELKDIYDSGQQLGHAIFEERSNTNKAILDKINKELNVVQSAYNEVNNSFFVDGVDIDPADSDAIAEIDTHIDGMVFEYNKDNDILIGIKSELIKENKKHTEHIDSIADGRYDEMVSKVEAIKNKINDINSFTKFKSSIDKATTTVDLNSLTQRVEQSDWYANATAKAKIHIVERIARRRKEIENANDPDNATPINPDPSKGVSINGNIVGIDSTGNHFVDINELFNKGLKKRYSVEDIIYIQGVKHTIRNITVDTQSNEIDLLVKNANGVIKIINLDTVIESMLIDNIDDLLNTTKTFKPKELIALANGIELYLNSALNNIDLFNYINESGFIDKVNTIIEVVNNEVSNKRTQSIYNQLKRYEDAIVLHKSLTAKFRAFRSNESISTDNIDSISVSIVRSVFKSINKNMDADTVINDIITNNTYNISAQIKLQVQSIMTLNDSIEQTMLDTSPVAVTDTIPITDDVDTAIIKDVVQRNSFTENAVNDYTPTNNYFDVLLTSNQIEHFKKIHTLIESMLSVSTNSKLTPIDVMEYIYNTYPSKSIFTETVYSIIFDIRLIQQIKAYGVSNPTVFNEYATKNKNTVDLLNALDNLIGNGYTDVFYNKTTIEDYFDRIATSKQIRFDGVRSEFDLFKLLKNIDPTDVNATVEVTMFNNGVREKTVISVEDIYRIQNDLEKATTLQACKTDNGYSFYYEYDGRMIEVSRIKDTQSKNVKFINGQLTTPIQSNSFKELIKDISSSQTIDINLDGKRFSYTLYNEFKALHSLIEAYHISPSDYNKTKLSDFINVTTNAHAKIKSASVFSRLVSSVANFNYQEELASKSNFVKITDYVNETYINGIYEFTSQLFRNKAIKTDTTPINKVPSETILNTIYNSLPNIIDNFGNQFSQRSKLNNTLTSKRLQTVYISNKSNGSNNLVDTTESINLLEALNVKRHTGVPIAYYYGSDADNVDTANMSATEKDSFVKASNEIRQLHGSNAVFYTYVKHPSGRVSAIPVRIATANISNDPFAKQHMDYIWTNILNNIRSNIALKQDTDLNVIIFDNDTVISKDEVLADMSDMIATGNNNKGNTFFNFTYANNILTLEYIDSNAGNGKPSDTVINIHFNKNGIAYKYDTKINNNFIKTSAIRYNTDTPIKELIDILMYSDKGPNILNSVYRGVNISKNKISNIKFDDSGKQITKYKTLPIEVDFANKTIPNKFIPIQEYYNDTPKTYANELQYHIENGNFVTNIQPVLNDKGKVISYVSAKGKYQPTYNITATPTQILEHTDFNTISLGYSSVTDAVADFINHAGEFAKYNYQLFNTYYEDGKIIDASNDISNFIKSLSKKGKFIISKQAAEVQLTHSDGNIGINPNIASTYVFNPNNHAKLIYHEILHKSLTEGVSNESLNNNMTDIVYIVQNLYAIANDPNINAAHRNNINSLLDRIFVNQKLNDNPTDTEIENALRNNRAWQELFTYAFTNRYISDSLNKLDYKGAIIEERKSLWDKIVDIFIKLLNVNIRSNSYLNAIKGISSNLINNGKSSNDTGLLDTLPPVAIPLLDLDNESVSIDKAMEVSDRIDIDTLDIQFVNDYDPSELFSSISERQQGARLNEVQYSPLLYSTNSLHLQVQSSIDTYRTNQTINNIKIC